MRHRVIAMLAVGIAAAAFTLPIRSQSAPTPPANEANLRAVPGGQVSAYQPPNANKDQPPCVRHAGSAVQQKNGDCPPPGARSYSKDQLDRTGEKNLGPALQKLDPSITTRGH